MLHISRKDMDRFLKEKDSYKEFLATGKSQDRKSTTRTTTMEEGDKIIAEISKHTKEHQSRSIYILTKVKLTPKAQSKSISSQNNVAMKIISHWKCLLQTWR